MPRLSCLLGLIVLATGMPAIGQESADDAETNRVFNQLSQTLKQVGNTTIGDDGVWRLKRDHWELVAKRPSDLEDQALERQRKEMERRVEQWRAANVGEDQIARMTERRNPEYAGIVKLVARLNIESGGYRGFNGMGSGMRASYGEFRNSKLVGRLDYNSEDPEDGPIRFRVREDVGLRRAISVVDDDVQTRIMLRGSGQMALLQRDRSGVRIFLIADDEPIQLQGDSFAALARKHETALRDQVSPLLESFGLSPLPIDAMLKTEPPKVDVAEVRPLQFKLDELSEDGAAAALKPLLRVCLVDGRLAPSEFFGSKQLLEKELKRVRAEYKASLEGAVERLKQAKAPQSQINTLRQKLGGFDEDQNARARRFGGFNALGGRMREEQPEMQLFTQLQQAVGNSGSSRSNGGPQRYSGSFSANAVKGRLARNGKALRFSTNDSAVAILLNLSPEYSEFSVEVEAGVIVVSQAEDGSASAIRLGGEEPWVIRGKSYLSMLAENLDAFRKNIGSVADELGMTGLDPFASDIQSAVVARLREGLPADLSTENSVAEMDSVIFPLLASREYLSLLVERLDGDEKALVQKRLDDLGGE